MATNTNPFYTYSATAGSSKTLQKPQDGGDNNQWGNYINTDLDEIVSAVNALSDKIADANEKTLVDFTATGSAVNHVGITNAAAGSGPTISTAGTDSNVDLNVTPKGTGDSVFTNKIKVDDVIEKTTDHGVEIDGVLVKDGDVGVATISSKAGTSVGVTLGTDSGDDFNVGSGKLVVEGDTGNVGIGTNAPEAKFNVKIGSAGSVTAWTEADDLILESNGVAGISILTPDDSASRLVFGSPSSNQGAALFYRQNLNKINVGTLQSGGAIALRSGANVDALYIDGNQNVGIGNTAPEADLHIGSYQSGSGQTATLRLSEGDGSGASTGFDIKYVGSSNNLVFTSKDGSGNFADRVSINRDTGIITGHYGGKTNVQITTGGVYNFTPASTTGTLLVYGTHDDVDQLIVWVSFKVGSGGYSRHLNVSASSLSSFISGAQGSLTNGYLNVSVSDNGNIYIANGLGVTASSAFFSVVLIGR